MSLNLKPNLALTEHYIFMVRDQQVMLDRDLAFLYGVETRVLNQAVKRNIARFPEPFRFQLTQMENDQLVTDCDRFASLKHSTSLPYAFTEQGVAMFIICPYDNRPEIKASCLESAKKLAPYKFF